MEPSTTDMQSLHEVKVLQTGVSQRHQVVMTCETISHYHQLGRQQWITTANFGSPKAPVFACKTGRWIVEKTNRMHQKSPFGDLKWTPPPHTQLPSAPCRPSGLDVPHLPLHFYTPQSSFSRNMPAAHPSTASAPTSHYLMWHYNCLWTLKC